MKSSQSLIDKIIAAHGGALATHSTTQYFYFGEDYLLRRHDYTAPAVPPTFSKFVEIARFYFPCKI